MAGQCSRIGNLAVVLLGTVGSFATPARRQSALERCRIGQRLREAVDGGGKAICFLFTLPFRKGEVDDKEASD
jgi:hypothetical protein